MTASSPCSQSTESPVCAWPGLKISQPSCGGLRWWGTAASTASLHHTTPLYHTKHLQGTTTNISTAQHLGTVEWKTPQEVGDDTGGWQRTAFPTGSQYLLSLSLRGRIDTIVDLPDTMVDLPDTMVVVPDAIGDLSDTMVDLLVTVVDTPDTMVDLPGTIILGS